ncbi:hypothetical protein UFOVP239_16 [uncultured Caudovirales phage]|uniref:Uncharacterized protein n=1 Tax=uncultured Caudovirales phage TaxID=2100421 RepID=A0A6J7WV23_9CAUD|nr:hypothetical protein UFOVP239_16 [uncultured Caudovirales phage]
MQDFREMIKMTVDSVNKTQSVLAYCDYIASLIRKNLKSCDREQIVFSVSREQSDIHPEDGYMVTTKKTIMVEDCFGKKYKITVEEV